MTEITGARSAEPGEAACRPWGVLITLLWVVAAEGIRDLVDIGLDRSPLSALGAHNYPAHVLQITLSWIVPLQHANDIPVFEPKVPNTVARANAQRFLIQQQPLDFGRERYDFLDLRWAMLKLKVAAAVVILLLLWGIYRIGWWIFA